MAKHRFPKSQVVECSWKVAKEVVKDGIRLNVYDLLEQRRIRNREKRKRRKARKVEAAAAAEATEAEKNDTEDDPDGMQSTNLHEILGSWGASSKVETEEKSSNVNKDIPWKFRVSLDDRDSQRVNSFMSTLFPDFSEFRSEKASSAQAAASDGTSHFVTDQFPAANIAWPSLPDTDNSDNSSDEDDDILTIKPEVRRFEVPFAQPQSEPSAAKLKTTKRSTIEKFPGRIAGDMSILRKEPRCFGTDIARLSVIVVEFPAFPSIALSTVQRESKLESRH